MAAVEAHHFVETYSLALNWRCTLIRFSGSALQASDLITRLLIRVNAIHDKLERIGPFASRKDLSLRGSGTAIPDTLSNGVVDKNGFLPDCAIPASEVVDVEVLDVDAVDEDVAFVGEVEALEEVYEG